MQSCRDVAADISAWPRRRALHPQTSHRTRDELSADSKRFGGWFPRGDARQGDDCFRSRSGRLNGFQPTSIGRAPLRCLGPVTSYASAGSWAGGVSYPSGRARTRRRSGIACNSWINACCAAVCSCSSNACCPATCCATSQLSRGFLDTTSKMLSPCFRAFFSFPHTLDCLIYLDELNDANGTLAIVPGSHRRIHDPLPADCYDELPGQRVVRGPAGTCIIMHSNLWHRALPTRRDGEKRRLLILCYGPTWMRYSPFGVKPEDSLVDALLDEADSETKELLGIGGYQ